jgi:hypothetical protein
VLKRTVRQWRKRRRVRVAFAAQAAEVVRERQRFELERGAVLEAENASLRRQLAEAHDHARWLAGRVQALERLHDVSRRTSIEVAQEP